MTITLADIRTQVAQTLDAAGPDLAADYDVDAIADAIHARWGLVDVATLDPSEFWTIVEAHDLG